MRFRSWASLSPYLLVIPVVLALSGSLFHFRSEIAEFSDLKSYLPADITKTCPYATTIAELDAKWGGLALDMSVAHAGSGVRLRRLFHKLKTADKITIGVIGGSITFGHGLQRGDKSWPKLLAAALEDSLGVKVEMVNGAIPATGTDYFSVCFDQHVPRNADLYIHESAVNDILVERYGGRHGTVEQTESLVRQLLGRGAAVMMLSTWSLPHDYISGADRHSIVSEYYDVPRISTRSFLYPYIMQHDEEKKVHYAPTDWGHQNQKGHEYMAHVLLRHILRIGCEQALNDYDPEERPYPGFEGHGMNYTFDPFVVPAVRIQQRLGQKPLPDQKSNCLSANVRLPDGSPQLAPSETKGFEDFTWADKQAWAAEVPGSRITFSDIEVSGGELALYYIRDRWEMGELKCWVDNKPNTAVVLTGNWAYVSVGSAGVVASNLAPGKHSLTCELLAETKAEKKTTKARIIAVLST